MSNFGTKQTIIDVNGKSVVRVAVKTHVVSGTDNICEVVKKYTQGLLQDGDIVVVSERILAITQGRSFFIKDIKPSFWANVLYKHVTNNPGGIGLRSPYTMELALREAGLLQILFASLCALVTKPFGLKGVFYKVAGNGLNAIDGPCDYTLYPGNVSAKLGPKEPEKAAYEISNALRGKPVVIIDANDLGRRIEGATKEVDRNFVLEAMRDNPMGQRDEQTPIVLIRHSV